jgi:hypothetical protein
MGKRRKVRTKNLVKPLSEAKVKVREFRQKNILGERKPIVDFYNGHHHSCAIFDGEECDCKLNIISKETQ